MNVVYDLKKIPLGRNEFILITVLVLDLFVMFDLIYDYRTDAPYIHLIVDQALCLLLTIGIGIFGTLSLLRHKRKGLQYESIISRLDLKAKQAELIKSGITSLLENQFNNWSFTVAEKEVALFLIKGFSLKEIADFRATKESTIRRQASTIYQKSETSGRRELTAFFLEDFLPPADL